MYTCESSKDCIIEVGSFLKEHIEPPQEWIENPEFNITGHIFEKPIIIEEIDVIVRKVRKSWHKYQSSIINDTIITTTEIQQIRQELNQCLDVIVTCLKFCSDETLRRRYIFTTFTLINDTLKPIIKPLDELNGHVLVAPSNMNSKNLNCPYSHFYHTYLILQYHILILICMSNDLNEIEMNLKRFIRDLMCASHKGFEIDDKSAFSCSITRNIWLILRLTSEKFFDPDKFCTIFNSQIQNEPDKSFVLWILTHVASLQLSNRSKPNYELLEPSLKQLLNGPGIILPSLQTIQPLLCDLWLRDGRIEPYQILWDHFSKKLNTTSRQQIETITVREIVELTDTILWAPKDCSTDFEFFLGLMVVHLREHPQHWMKIKGRIYSQLSPNKIRDLDGAGIFHVGLLYIILANVNFEDLSKKFTNLIQGLCEDRKQSKLIWSLYSAFMIRHVRENRSLMYFGVPFVKILEDASQDCKKFRLIKGFINDFVLIVNSSTNLQLHQWVLINSWTRKYLTTCYFHDLVDFIKILISTINKLDENQVWCDWEESFKYHIYPSLKCVCTNSPESPVIGGVLVAKITKLSPSLIHDSFTYYTGESVSPKISNSFLCEILKNYPQNFIMSSAQESLTLQCWVKICLLTSENHEILTESIAKLDTVPQFLKNLIKAPKDPICDFINYLSLDLKSHMGSKQILMLCETCFGETDIWISNFLSQSQNEAAVLRLYTCLGLAFYKIGALLYDRHKPTCVYAKLVFSLLLPKGKTPHIFIVQALKKTWHLFFESAVNLNQNDPFLDKILQDLIVKYLGHFGVVDSPILKCLDNDVTRETILKKFATSYFKHPVKEDESNVFKALKILESFIESTTSCICLKNVIDKTLVGLFEVVMFHPQRSTALIVIRSIKLSALYRDVRNDFIKAVMDVTEKHLAFHTSNYFELLNALANYLPSDIRSTLGEIKKHVCNIEMKRGFGLDMNLRTPLDKLEKMVS